MWNAVVWYTHKNTLKVLVWRAMWLLTPFFRSHDDPLNRFFSVLWVSQNRCISHYRHHTPSQPTYEKRNNTAHHVKEVSPPSQRPPLAYLYQWYDPQSPIKHTAKEFSKKEICQDCYEIILTRLFVCFYFKNGKSEHLRKRNCSQRTIRMSSVRIRIPFI